MPGQAMPADGVPDMVVLENLHEASILECVDRRFRKNLIYVRGVVPSPCPANFLIGSLDRTQATFIFHIRSAFLAVLLPPAQTFTGSILVSVNPFKPLPLYTPNVMKSYHSKPLGAAPPHVYAIADTAYRALNTENTDQAVMIRHVPDRWISWVK